jgi:regulatory protein
MKASGGSIKARALQLLAQRERSRVELRRKLLAHARSEEPVEPPGEPDAEAPARVDALLDWLEFHGYLSTERFIESRVRVRAVRYGNLRIRQELQQHQLTLDAQAAAALAQSELERARTVCARKFPTAPASSAERARQARFLAGRGFSPDIVRRVLRDAGAGVADHEAVHDATDSR